MRCVRVFCAIAALSFCITTEARATPQYDIVALDILPGGLDSVATAISENGVVVGHSRVDRTGNVGRSRPVIWDANGDPTELWPNEGPSTPGAIPLGINSAGQIVGRYGVGSGVLVPEFGVPLGRAFIWDASNGRRDLGTLGGNRVEAVAINEIGQVAGSSYTGRIDTEGTVQEAFIWDSLNGIQSLGTLGGAFSRSSAINNLGRVAGTSWRADFSEAPFQWTSDSGMHDLGSVGGADTRALAMNDSGLTVGISWGATGFIIWNAGATSVVPITPGVSFWPSDINNLGQLVGYTGVPNEARVEAFVWTAQEGIVPLAPLLVNNSGWQLENATAINDRGQIVGYGYLNGQVRGFLMSPVPEPSTSLLIAPLVIFAMTKRRGLTSSIPSPPPLSGNRPSCLRTA